MSDNQKSKDNATALALLIVTGYTGYCDSLGFLIEAEDLGRVRREVYEHLKNEFDRDALKHAVNDGERPE